MTVHLVPLLMAGVLTACGVYMVLERNLTRSVLGLLLIGNGINLLIIDVSGPNGSPPIYNSTEGLETDADPLAQGLVLTAIVITMGVGAFMMALTYRSYRLTISDDIDDDEESTRVSHLSDEEIIAADEDLGAPVAPGELDAVVPDQLNTVVPDQLNTVVPDPLNAVVPDQLNAVVPDLFNAVVPDIEEPR